MNKNEVNCKNNNILSLDNNRSFENEDKSDCCV